MRTSKLIAVSGPPGSGKTTLSLKLAQEVYETTKKKVLYLSPDTLIPAMGLIFPRREKNSLASLGAALENVDLSITDILGVVATTSSMPNMGYVGYISGDGPYSYAMPQEAKVMQLFHILKDHFDYIFVDCDRNREDLISSIACGLCDLRIQIVNADVKSIAFYSFEPIQSKSIQILNLLDSDVYLPIQEIKEHFPGIQHTILYSRQMKMQMFEGNLMERLNDKMFRKSAKPIIDTLIAELEEDTVEELPDQNGEQPVPLANNPDEEFWR